MLGPPKPRRLDQPIAVSSEPSDDLPVGIVRLPNGHVANGPTAAEPSPRRLLDERRLDPGRGAAWGYERTSAWRVSTTDPDATPMRSGSGTALGYHDHYVVDGGKARVILDVLVTPADVMENVPMRDLLWRVRFRRKLRPHQVTGDTTYGTVENIVAVEDAGIRAYVSTPRHSIRVTYWSDRWPIGHPHQEPGASRASDRGGLLLARAFGVAVAKMTLERRPRDPLGPPLVADGDLAAAGAAAGAVGDERAAPAQGAPAPAVAALVVAAVAGHRAPAAGLVVARVELAPVAAGGPAALGAGAEAPLRRPAPAVGGGDGAVGGEGAGRADPLDRPGGHRPEGRRRRAAHDPPPIEPPRQGLPHALDHRHGTASLLAPATTPGHVSARTVARPQRRAARTRATAPARMARTLRRRAADRSRGSRSIVS